MLAQCYTYMTLQAAEASMRPRPPNRQKTSDFAGSRSVSFDLALLVISAVVYLNPLFGCTCLKLSIMGKSTTAKGDHEGRPRLGIAVDSFSHLGHLLIVFLSWFPCIN